ncbi:tetratricopeptide repeat protein [Streptomyces cavernae]|uniref:tetratricopeptide repeat protein n=1 Tax=Streptomyces cavernae TaxID=2259034 RepID=UPI001EE3E873|nr:tetratricopeptide repeat protein [Streptomyces cavernae]
MTVAEATERARLLMELGRHADARALLVRRIAEDPEDVRAWIRLSRCHAALGEPEEALAAIEEAVRRAPEDYDAVNVRAHALRRVGRLEEAADTAMRAIGIGPDWWGAYALLAEVQLFLPERYTRYEAYQTALDAVRYGPDEVGAHLTLWKLATVIGNHEMADRAERAILQLDPTHQFALSQQTAKAARDARAPAAAELYADALAVAPDSPGLRGGLDGAVYRMLRGTRWPALLCLLIAAGTVDVLPVHAVDDRAGLPLPQAARLGVLAVLAAVWGLGAWYPYRRLRTGVRLGMASLVRRRVWARIVLGQAAWCTACAVLVAVVPWEARGVPRLLAAAAVVPVLLTVWFDRRRIG